MSKATMPGATPAVSSSPSANGRAPTSADSISTLRASVPSLRNLVRERLEVSDDPNPHMVVESLLSDLDEDQLYEAARKGLGEIAQEVVRSFNTHRLRSRSNTSAKWGNASRSVNEYPEVFLRRICVGHDELGNGIWRYLGDCSSADLKGAEEIKRSQAQGLVSSADRLATLRKRLKRGQIVRDLTPAKVEAILNA
jgi:hypothetical protein